jgi:hypothetical protein
MTETTYLFHKGQLRSRQKLDYSRSIAGLVRVLYALDIWLRSLTRRWRPFSGEASDQAPPFEDAVNAYQKLAR